MTEKFIFEDERRDLARIAKLFFDRNRTNVAGGNISEKNNSQGRLYIRQYLY